MVTHLSYDEQRFRTADECLGAIRRFLALGWDISDVQPASRGAYIVVFRKADEDDATPALSDSRRSA